MARQEETELSLFTQNYWQTTFTLIFHSREESFAQTTSSSLERHKKQASQPQKSEMIVWKRPFHTLISAVLQDEISVMTKNSLENFSSKSLSDTSTLLSRKYKHRIINSLQRFAKIAKKRSKTPLAGKERQKKPRFLSLISTIRKQLHIIMWLFNL